ncbi:MAG: PAS domain S-box protein [Desulfatiglandales bacterium]
MNNAQDRIFKELSDLLYRRECAEDNHGTSLSRVDLLPILRDVLENAPHALALTDPKGNLLYVNPALLEMHGYDDPEEVLGSGIWLFCSNEREVQAFIKDLQEKGKGSSEHTAKRKDGTLFPVRISVNTVSGEAGGAFILLVSFIGARERTICERTTSAFLDIFRAVYSSAELSEIFPPVRKALGQVLDTDDFFIALYNKETDAISFPHFENGEDPGSATYRNKEFASLCADVIGSGGPKVYREEPLKDLHGRFRTESPGAVSKVWLGVPMKAGGDIIGVVGVQSQDDPHLYSENDLALMASISEQISIAIDHKRMENALRKTEKRYRGLLDSLQDGYYEVNLQGDFVYFNRALTRIFGYPSEELEGMDIRRFTDGATNQIMSQVFSDLTTTGEAVTDFEWRFLRKDEDQRLASMSISLIKDANGDAIGFQGILRDVTDQKRLEAALQHTQKMEAIGTLAGGIAHNFNNLLMGIQGNVSLMLMDLDKNHPFYPRLNSMEKLVQNGSQLTGQLLGYAREGRYQTMPSNLNKLIRETAEAFGMTKREIKIHYDLGDDIHEVMADHGQFEQILLNLLINAADAMVTNGELYLSTKNATHRDMEARAYRPKRGDYVAVSVRDTGVGMDRQTLDRVFEPFFTTKGPSRGTGLGLASVYGIVKSHGGYIDATSEKGAGTTFTIYFPAAGAKDPCKGPKRYSGDVHTILLVDDEAVIQEIGEEMLKRLGYKVLVAEDGEEALAIYRDRRHEVDLVILDMIMPGMGGGDVYDRLKEVNPDIRVLLSSGYNIDGEASVILERGCNGFIQKPFKISDLAQKVKEILKI